MIRASSVGAICTERIVLDEKKIEDAISELKSKAEAKKETFDTSPEKIMEESIRLSSVTGLSLVSKNLIKLLEKQKQAKEDPLPLGAKTHLEKLWLENNHYFTEISLSEGAIPILKGKIQEENAISLLHLIHFHNFTPFVKNTQRITKGFITGECDIQLPQSIIDIKVPENWISFRSKDGIPSEYFWQLIAYCYLYDKKEACLAYVLMEDPQEVVDIILKWKGEEQKEKYFKMQESITKLHPTQRIKLFFIDEPTVADSIIFLLKRLEKAEEYYNQLTYEQCMKL